MGSASPTTPIRGLLFVCLGNICRSPLAEGIFIHLARERGWEDRVRIDSAGTGDWHVGEPPDRRALAAARSRGVHLPSRCRQVRRSDFEEFDLLLAMDRDNRRNLLSLCPAPHRGKVRLMREFDSDPAEAGEWDVPDPYYGGPEGFDAVYEMLERCCRGLLESLDPSGNAPRGMGA